MSDSPLTLADLAHEVRSKNAGPFWTTLDVFLKDAAAFAVAGDPTVLNESIVAEIYDLDEADVRLFRIPALHVIKISFPRPVPQGGLHDRDMHSGQHHVPLALMRVPMPSDS